MLKYQLNLEDRIEKALEILVDKNHYLAVEVCKLGYPRFDKSVPTAGVAWDPKRKKIVYLFNEKFFNSITDEELAFIIAHEAIHVLNGHIFLLRDFQDKKRHFAKVKDSELKFRMKFLIAADCVVNDSLINLYGLKKIFTEPDREQIKLIYGQDTIKRDCHDLTVMDVYYLLPENIVNEIEIDAHDLWDSFFNSDGSVNKDFVKSMQDFVEKKQDNSNVSEKDAQDIEKLNKCLEKLGLKAGTDAAKKMRPIDGLNKDNLNWQKLLLKVVESRKVENAWNSPSKKLISIYPDIILPNYKPREKKKIFVAIDSSGSIDYEALSLFVSILKNTPKDFEIDAISFDTYCYKYDLKKDDRPQGGGGTNFQIIEDYICQNLKKYPEVVIVLTDGCGTFVEPKYPSNWLWLLYGHGSTEYCKSMKHFKLDDLLK